MLRAGWSILFLAVAACGEARPVRLVAGRSDTVVVNGRGLVPLRVRLVDEHGVERPAKRVRNQLTRAGVVELADDSHVTCNGHGDGEVLATYGKLETRITVLCRPIHGFLMPRVMQLAIGGQLPLELGAMDEHWKPVDMVAARVSVRDSQVAALVNGQVRARGRGTTAIDVEAGDCAVSIPVEVVGSSRSSEALLPNEQYAESLTMSAGELRSWRVPAGRYEISLFDGARAPAYLRIASHRMNCAPVPRVEQEFWCIAEDRASVIVHHTAPAGRGRQSTATLLIHRRADLGTESASWRQYPPVFPCPYTIR